MRIKSFEATTMQEALSLARTELGDEAIVLNTRHIKSNGVLGRYKPARIEVLAAVDAPESGEPASSRVPVFEEPAEVIAVAPVASPLVARAYTSSNTAVSEPQPEIQRMRSEIDELRSMMRGLLTMRTELPPADGPLLVRLGVDEDLARGELADLNHINDHEGLTVALAAKMQAFAQPFDFSQRQVIALVGPTGVGKTTTLAKLAARFSLEEGKKVALVSADTFRIGAVEQLKTYARIMGLPLEVALTPDEVRMGVEKHCDADVVLIDTVGRSQRSSAHLLELKAFVDAVDSVEVHLVTSATLTNEIQREVVDQFAMLSPRKLIVTKLDEAPTRGCLINLPLRTGLGISCTTAGQNVPQDIDIAEAGIIARLVVEAVE